ncbi:plastocyanin/azurin family copper-binding protein [Halorubellus sp. PRR65]|uniref:plastocyanin/azurin family copper-binding protein n=1 Tax=Halorubellus sp. PRR65 TaxID=3098148 RepID=UPI002B256AC5|nr:plastocyanin/azurin family copper-binding protein [Halorubellus sp. PRR65]
MDDSGRTDRTVRRRDLLGSVGVAAVATTAGCLASGDGTETKSGENAVVVGPGGSYVFEPSSLSVSVGDTVTWTWESANHNIVVDSQPEGAEWQGTDGDGSKTYDSEHTYEYTFETAGTYEYYCQPHEGLGMTGEVVVEE